MAIDQNITLSLKWDEISRKNYFPETKMKLPSHSEDVIIIIISKHLAGLHGK